MTPHRSPVVPPRPRPTTPATLALRSSTAGWYAEWKARKEGAPAAAPEPAPAAAPAADDAAAALARWLAGEGK